MMFCSRHDAAVSLRSPNRFGLSSHRSSRRSPSPHASRRLAIETLEARLALAADLAPDLDTELTHGGVCACPICSGQGLEQLVAPQGADTIAASATTSSGSTSLASVPQLSSNPAARAKLYLDFNGHVQGTWGSWSNVRTPAFDQDGNTSAFSSSEIAAIREVWARVAEDYAPFNIDVTTIEPSSFADRTAVRVAVGGNWSDWFGSSAGGVAYVGAFTNSAPNVAFVFSKALGGGNSRYVAEAAAHEAGHLFGLSHQSTYAGSALAQNYNSGSSTLAPIMGVGYYASRTTWHYGPTDSGPSSYQNDVSILAGASNGFGRRPDDYGDTTSAPSALVVHSGSVNLKGIIEEDRDSDVWRFSTGGGTVRLNLNVAQFGANLDAVLELKNASGQIVAASNSASSLNASLSATLAAGTYYVVARSSGGYGNMGQYTLTGSVPSSGSTGGSTGGTTTSGTPEITVKVGTSLVSDGGTVSFGTTYAGTPVTRTITILNQGTRTLSLSRPSSVPAGYSIVSNIGQTSLAPGQSTSLTIRMNASVAGTFGGRIVISSNDSSEGQYDLNLTGTARSATTTTPTSTSSTRRILDNGQAGYTVSGGWSTRTGSGRDSDMQLAGRNTGTNAATARWNFTGLAAGTYRVWMTWAGGSGNASNAPISLYNGSRLVRTVTVDQRAAASGLSADGSNWKLITTLSVTGSQLVVQLRNNANGTVMGDAVRIERVAGAALPDEAFAGPSAAEAAIMTQETPDRAWDLRGDETAESSSAEPVASQLDAALMELVSSSGQWTINRAWDNIAGGDDSPDDEGEDHFHQPLLEESWLEEICRTIA